ncbi:MAG: GIY-YIG nuclease family protein, partial [Sphingomonas sp.]
MTNKPFGVLYVGVTSSLARIAAHREKRGSAFAAKWDCTRLVLIEVHDTIEDAILREKRLKNWNRVWKCRLISEQNPNWDDLWDLLNGGAVESAVPDNLAGAAGPPGPATPAPRTNPPGA